MYSLNLCQYDFVELNRFNQLRVNTFIPEAFVTKYKTEGILRVDPGYKYDMIIYMTKGYCPIKFLLTIEKLYVEKLHQIFSCQKRDLDIRKTDVICSYLVVIEGKYLQKIQSLDSVFMARLFDGHILVTKQYGYPDTFFFGELQTILED